MRVAPLSFMSACSSRTYRRETEKTNTHAVVVRVPVILQLHVGNRGSTIMKDRTGVRLLSVKSLKQQSVIRHQGDLRICKSPSSIDIILLKHMEVLTNSLSGTHNNLLQTVQNLTDGSREISSYYHEYDYDVHTPGNGFRSFVKIIELFILRLSAVSMLTPSLAKVMLMGECEVFADTLTKSLAVARLIREKGTNFTVMNESSELDQEIFARVFQFTAQDIEPLYSDLGSFFLLKGFQQQFKQNMFLFNLLSVPLLSQIRMLTDGKFAAQVQAHHASNGTISSLKSASLRTFPINLIMRLFMRPSGVSVTWVTVSRESPWVVRISDTKSPARIEHHKEPRGGFVNCMLIKPSLVRDNSIKSLVLFAHGGGFITGSPEGYTDFLSRLSRDISVPVLVPDYAKAPERPYPAALQDVLDVYLFLTSGDQKAADMIGFDPDHVVLSGDSAGSNLALALSFTLNQIRKSGLSSADSNANPMDVRMPKALALQYPSVTGFIAVPSTTILTFDPILTVSLYALSRSFYAEVDPKIEDELWYKKDPDVKGTIRRFNDRLKDPLMNIMAYEEWSDLKDLPLYVTACEMDAIFDHSILLAKMWQGPVKLDIAREMSHGFLIGNMGPALQPTIKLCIDRIAEGMGVKM